MWLRGTLSRTSLFASFVFTIVLVIVTPVFSSNYFPDRITFAHFVLPRERESKSSIYTEARDISMMAEDFVRLRSTGL